MRKMCCGPSKMPRRFKGYPGWSYHPTKGFRRDSGWTRRQDYNRIVYSMKNDRESAVHARFPGLFAY